jgi:topoisomerase-4 subunit B
MPSQLRETTMNKNSRKLIKVIMPTQKPKAKKANKLVNDLMGKNAELRLKFIAENANKSFNLDI